MSDGKKLIAAILAAGSVEHLRAVNAELFIDDELPLYQYVRNHYRRYSELPLLATVETDNQMRFPQAPENIGYYLTKLQDRRMFTMVREDFLALRTALQRFDVDSTRGAIDRLKIACRETQVETEVQSVLEAARDVLGEYAEAHANPGVSGIPTGWRDFDEAIGGYQKGDLVSWVARMGVGKSYLLIKQAVSAWEAGYNVLFVTMEMSITQITRRIVGLGSGINPDYIRKGSLDTYGVQRLERYVRDMVHADRFNIFAGSFSKKVSDLELLVHELSPDIIFVDGAYLMRPDVMPKSGARIERVAEVYDELKKLTITSDRPIITTSQFSRQAGKRGKDGSLETISFSDAIAMHSSIVLSIKEGSPPYEKTRRDIEILKGREGEAGTYPINYAFSPINLDQVEASQAVAESVSVDWMS